MFGLEINEIKLVYRGRNGDVYVGWNDHGFSLTKMVKEDTIHYSVCEGSKLLITWSEGVDGTPIREQEDV